MTKQCIICGSDYEVVSSAAKRAKYCPGCRRTAKIMNQRNYERGEQHRKPAIVVPRKKKRIPTIAEVNAAARERGISYGQMSGLM